MTKEERAELWRRFAKSACDVLAHPDTPPAVYRPLSETLLQIAPDDLICNLRLLLPHVPGYPEERVLVDDFGDYCLDLGSVISDVLADDWTPLRIRRPLCSLIAEFDEKARKTDPQAYMFAVARMLFPETLIIVAGSEDDEPTDDEPQQSAGAVC